MTTSTSLPATGRRLILDSRLTGPRNRANGGFISGIVASLLGGTATVRLHRPVRLATPLDLHRDGAGLAVRDRGRLVVSAHPAEPFVELPPVRPTVDDALRASDAHPLRDVRHLLSDCVVCGPHRTDGLGVVWGPLPGHPEMLAAPFVPTARDATAGVVHEEALWGALDCTGYPARLLADRRIALLGTMTAHVRRQVAVGECLVVVGWTLTDHGRAHDTATALLDPSGRVVASARSTWVELRHQRLARLAGSLL